MRQLQKKLRSGSLDLKQDDPFELFVAATSIRYCYYAETHKILGNTYGMCVLQVSVYVIMCQLCVLLASFRGLAVGEVIWFAQFAKHARSTPGYTLSGYSQLYCYVNVHPCIQVMKGLRMDFWKVEARGGWK